MEKTGLFETPGFITGIIIAKSNYDLNGFGPHEGCICVSDDNDSNFTYLKFYDQTHVMEMAEMIISGDVTDIVVEQGRGIMGLVEKMAFEGIVPNQYIQPAGERFDKNKIIEKRRTDR